MNKKIVFIRDDDVYKAGKTFRNIFEFCLQEKIPVVYGVIPKKITPDLIKQLNKAKNRHPHLIDIAQHGWQHKNYNQDLTNKYEFGPSRGYEKQKKDIKNGIYKMTRAFGKNFTPAFIPPYHGYNKTTLEIINQSGFLVFSSGETMNIKGKKFLDLPSQFSLNSYGKYGRPLAVKFEVLVKDIVKFLNSENKILGMVFHHYALNSSAKLKEMQKTFLFLKKIAQKGNIKMVLFSDILRQKGVKPKGFLWQ